MLSSNISSSVVTYTSTTIHNIHTSIPPQITPLLLPYLPSTHLPHTPYISSLNTTSSDQNPLRPTMLLPRPCPRSTSPSQTTKPSQPHCLVGLSVADITRPLDPITGPSPVSSAFSKSTEYTEMLISSTLFTDQFSRVRTGRRDSSTAETGVHISRPTGNKFGKLKDVTHKVHCHVHVDEMR